jgi:hypothetical protein
VRTTLVGCCLALLFPAVASAHGSGSHGYVSKITRIVNGNGITAAAGEEGEIRLSTPPGKTVIVFGYQHEPYLKFEHARVYANTSSPTLYANREEAAPPAASAAARPQWVDQAIEGRVFAWHDRRIHWVGQERPAPVRENPHARHHIRDWTVDGTVDGERFAVQGSRDWAAEKRGPGYVWISYVFVAGFVLYVGYALISSRLKKQRLTARS